MKQYKGRIVGPNTMEIELPPRLKGLMELLPPEAKNNFLIFSMVGWGILDGIINGILTYRGEGAIVEIGMGASSFILAKYCQESNLPLYSCDLEMGGIFEAFKEPLFKQHHCFIGTSEDFIKQFEGDPLIVFIDGDHTYETTKMEGDFFLDKLQIGGVCLFHDMVPPSEEWLSSKRCGDVWKYRKELEANPDLDVLTFPYGAIDVGLTMVMKHQKNVDRHYWLKNGRLDS